MYKCHVYIHFENWLTEGLCFHMYPAMVIIKTNLCTFNIILHAIIVNRQFIGQQMRSDVLYLRYKN